MSKVKLTNQQLLERVNPITINSYPSLSAAISNIRSIVTNYSMDHNFVINSVNKFNDPLSLLMEYCFRFKDGDLIKDSDISIDDIKHYLLACFNWNMTLKNQIRKRVEFYYPELLATTKSATITGCIRSFCNS